MINPNDKPSWQEEAGNTILSGLRQKSRDAKAKPLVIPDVAVAEPVEPVIEQKERAKTFEGSGRNIVDTAKQAYKGVLNVIEESPIPLFGKNSLGTNTLGKVSDAIPLFKKVLSPEDSVEKRTEEIKKLSLDIEERTPENLTLTQQGFRAALESAPLTAVAMVTSIFGTPAAGLSIMGGYTGALEYNEAREKGRTFAQSLTYGTVQGSIEAFTERLGLGPLMRMFKNKGDGFMQDAIAYGTRELIGENAAEFGQSMTAWYAGLDEALMNPDLSKTDKLMLQAQRQYVASVAALSMSGTTTTATAGVKGAVAQIEENNLPKRSEGWVKTRATYKRKDKDGNVIEKETGADVYTKIFYSNGEVVPAEKAKKTTSVKEDNSKKAPANKYGMYSKLQEALFNMKQETNNPQDVMNYFKNKAVVWDEMRDSGMLTFLQKNIAEGKPVTRTKLMNKFYEGSLINTMDKVTLSTKKNQATIELTPEHRIADSVIYGRPLPENANGRPFTSEEIIKKSVTNGKEIYEEIINDIITDMIMRLADGVSLPNKITTNLDLIDNKQYPLNTFDFYLKETNSEYSQTEIVDSVYDATKKANQVRINEIQAQADDLGTSNIGASRVPLRGYTPEEKIKFVEKELDSKYVEALKKASINFSLAYIEGSPEYIWTVTTDTRNEGVEKYTVIGNNDNGYDIKVQEVDEMGNTLSMPTEQQHESTLNEAQAFIKSRNPMAEEETKFALADMVSNGYSDAMPWETYKETLIVMDSPQRKDVFGDTKLIGGYPNSHWSIDNIALHFRTTERKDSNGDTVLFIEELQSDWLEAGERRGWKNSDDLLKANTMLLDSSVKNKKTAKEIISEFRANLKEQFPEDVLPVKDGVNFRQFLKAYEYLGYTVEVNLLKDVYKSKDTEIDDLVNKFSKAYGNTDEGIDPLKNFLLFFEIVRQDAYSAIYDSMGGTVFRTNEPAPSQEQIDANKDFEYDNEYWKKLVSIDSYENMEKQINIIEKRRKVVTKLESAVPKMPSKNKWHELGMRVAMQMAVEGGYKKIAWTNSDEQVRRWKKGPTEIEKYNKALDKTVTVKIPEGANKRMFVNLYDNKMVSYAQRLANQYNSKSGKTIIDFDDNWTLEEHQRLEADPNIKENQKNYYLDISPEMVEAVNTGRVKFYRRGGLVSNNKKYRRKFAEGGSVEAPFSNVKDFIIDKIENGKLPWYVPKTKVINAVNEEFFLLGLNPSKEDVTNLYDKFSDSLKIFEPEVREQINSSFNNEFDSYFNYEIPSSTTENANQVAEASAIAAGGGTLAEWFNKGKNVRIPGEDKASFKTLAKDSVKQLTRSDAAFKAGKTGLSTFRPLKAFTPSMLATGPDPLTRQLLTRGASFLSKASPILSILTPSSLADGTLPEEGTPEYIEAMNRFSSTNDSFKNYSSSILNSSESIGEKRDKRVKKAEAMARVEAVAKAEKQAKAERERIQKEKDKQTKVDKQGNKGYTGQGNQGKAGNQGGSSSSYNSSGSGYSGGSSKNYGVTGKRVTGGR